MAQEQREKTKRRKSGRDCFLSLTDAANRKKEKEREKGSPCAIKEAEMAERREGGKQKQKHMRWQDYAAFLH